MHNVWVYIDGVSYKIAKNYGIQLTCTKVAGWRLWAQTSTTEFNQLLGGEFEGGFFRIEVKGVVICDNADYGSE